MVIFNEEFCPRCDAKAKLNTRGRKLSFRGEEFKVLDRYYKCAQCGEEFGTTKSDELAITQLYNLYREKRKILFPEEIKELREIFGLSKRKMSILLGWGENTYGLYEGGAVPDEAHSNLLKAIKEKPELLKKFAIDSPDLIGAKKIKKIEIGVEKLKRPVHSDPILSTIWPRQISSFTGFAMPDIKKFSHMVIFFIKRGIQFRAKLNKMLFYADFFSYYLRVKSISGALYSAIPLGPVPENYDIIFSLLRKNGYIDTETAFINREGEVVENFIALQNFDSSLFNEDELQVVELIADILEKMSTKKIIDLSHQEKGWIANIKRRSLINYHLYANQLKIIGLVLKGFQTKHSHQ